MTFRYRHLGLLVTSDLEMPELASVPDDGGAPDLRLCLDAHGGAAILCGDAPAWDATDPDHVVMRLPQIGTVRIDNGNAITFAPQPGLDRIDARAFLMGPVQAILWYQRGALPFHASAVLGPNGVIALAGRSGAGKSTLAAAFVRQGLPLVADDMMVLEWVGDTPCVRAGAARVRLWSDSLDQLAIPADGLERAISGKEKYLLPATATTGFLPLRALFMPDRGDRTDIRFSRVQGPRAMGALAGALHMRAAAKALGRDPQIFADIDKLARSPAEIWNVEVPDDLARLAEVTDQLRRIAAAEADQLH